MTQLFFGQFHVREKSHIVAEVVGMPQLFPLAVSCTWDEGGVQPLFLGTRPWHSSVDIGIHILSIINGWLKHCILQVCAEFTLPCFGDTRVKWQCLVNQQMREHATVIVHSFARYKSIRKGYSNLLIPILIYRKLCGPYRQKGLGNGTSQLYRIHMKCANAVWWNAH